MLLYIFILVKRSSFRNCSLYFTTRKAFFDQKVEENVKEFSNGKQRFRLTNGAPPLLVAIEFFLLILFPAIGSVALDWIAALLAIESRQKAIDIFQKGMKFHMTLHGEPLFVEIDPLCRLRDDDQAMYSLIPLRKVHSEKSVLVAVIISSYVTHHPLPFSHVLFVNRRKRNPKNIAPLR